MDILLRLLGWRKEIIPPALNVGRWVWLVILLLPFGLPAIGLAEKLSILEVDINSYQVHQAVKQMDLPKSIQVRYFTLADLTGDPAAKAFIVDSKVVLVNVMMTQLADYMVDEGLMDGRRVYALNRAGDTEGLAKKGFRFDAAIMDYYHHRSVPNLVSLVSLAVNRHVDASVSFKPLEKVPEVCIHHPDAPALFTELAAFNQWNAARRIMIPAIHGWESSSTARP
ncbi:hypothetical protein [Desulfosarcina cetonica]|uniref:hypothetical protein n=1 Tax=Desulfosarcina cetonica TaxID=90730 RepID=UPI0006CF6761|nr:hypothetical protein [Desulfosarcina cetonica]